MFGSKHRKQTFSLSQTNNRRILSTYFRSAMEDQRYPPKQNLVALLDLEKSKYMTLWQYSPIREYPQDSESYCDTSRKE
jgi:hypothetical protein